MNHQGIKITSFILAGLVIIIGLIMDIRRPSDMFPFSMITIPPALVMMFLGFVYGHLFRRRNELNQNLNNLLKSCYMFFLIGSLWLIGFFFFRALLDSDYHFFANQDLIENLKKYLIYTIIGFQIIAFVFALLFDIVITGENPPQSQQ